MADNERLIETRDPSFWNPCADSEWAYVGVPLSRCEAVSGPHQVEKIDCTGLLTESVQAMFQEIVEAFGEEFVPTSKADGFLCYSSSSRKRFNERATEAINNLVCRGSGERPSFLMRERMRWLVNFAHPYSFLRNDEYLCSELFGTRSNVPFDDREDEVDGLVKCLEESNRPHDKALLYIFLGNWIRVLLLYLSVVTEPSETSVLNNKLQSTIQQRALLACFNAFDAGAEDWCVRVGFHSLDPSSGATVLYVKCIST